MISLIKGVLETERRNFQEGTGLASIKDLKPR